jgi:hypothetical protein
MLPNREPPSTGKMGVSLTTNNLSSPLMVSKLARIFLVYLVRSAMNGDLIARRVLNDAELVVYNDDNEQVYP